MNDKIIDALLIVTEGDEAFMKELSAAFVTNFEDFKAIMIEALDNRDLSKYRSIIHKVKPSFLTIALNDEFEKVDKFSESLNSYSESEIEAFKKWVIAFSDELIKILKAVVVN